MKNERRGIDHETCQCEVLRIEYDFIKRLGFLWMANDDGSDMDGCIETFMAIDRRVTRIITMAGSVTDTIYFKKAGKWRSYVSGETVPA